MASQKWLFGQRLFQILREKGLSQKEFSARVGYSEPYISLVIKGKIEFSYTAAATFIQATGILADYFFHNAVNDDFEDLNKRLALIKTRKAKKGAIKAAKA